MAYTFNQNNIVTFDSKGNTLLPNGLTVLGLASAGFVKTDANGRFFIDTGGASGGQTTNALTFNNSGSGSASGVTFDGSTAVTVSYNSIGAQPLASNLTSLASLTYTAPAFVKMTGAGTFTLDTSTYGGIPTLQQVTTAGNTTNLAVILTNTAATSQVSISVDANGDVILTAGTNKNFYFSGDVVAFSSAAPPPSTWWDSLPIATASTLGGIKVGSGLTIDGSGVLSIAGGVVGQTTYSLTFNSSGTGDSSGTTFNGSVARTVSYNTIGAAASVHAHVISDITNLQTTLDAKLNGSSSAGNITYWSSTAATLAGDDRFFWDTVNKKIRIQSPDQSKQFTIEIGNDGNIVFTSGTNQNFHFSGDVIAFSALTPPVSTWWDNLPIATASTLGGIKVGSGLAIDGSGVLSVTGAGVGSVTSVSLAAPTGFTVSGSPVTSSGTLTLAFASGYSLPTTTSQTNWDTAYGWGNHASAGYQVTSQKGVANGYASLDAGGKVPVSQLPSSLMEYKGVWNASTNSPSLIDGTGDTGDVYRVSVAGIRNLGSGNISFEVGDYVIYNGTTWEKSDTTDAVASVNGFTGIVVLSTADISENTNLYFTDARARSAISLTVTGSSGSATYSSVTGVLNIPTYTLAGLGGEPAITAGTTSQYWRGDKSWQTFNLQNLTSVGNTTNQGIVLTNTAGTKSVTVSVDTNGNIIFNAGTNQNFHFSGDVIAFSSLTPPLSTWWDSLPVATASTLGGIKIGSGLSIDGAGVVSVTGGSSAIWGNITGTLSNQTDLWNALSGKEPTLTKGNLTESTSSVLTITGGANAVIGSGTSIQVSQASGSQSGYLSSADWTTFNNKQNALTNPVTGTGTQNYIAKFNTTGSILANSQIRDDGTGVSIGGAPSSYKLDITGTLRASTSVTSPIYTHTSSVVFTAPDGQALSTTLKTGATTGFDTAGALLIYTGTAASSASGSISMYSGAAAGAASGNINIYTSTGGIVGTSSASPSGTINIYTGNAGAPTRSNGATAGPLNIYTGNGGVGNPFSSNTSIGGAGGALTIYSGNGAAATGGGNAYGGAGGSLIIRSGDGGNAVLGNGSIASGGNSGDITLVTGTPGTGTTINGTSGSIYLKVNTSTTVLTVSDNVYKFDVSGTTRITGNTTISDSTATITNGANQVVISVDANGNIIFTAGTDKNFHFSGDVVAFSSLTPPAANWWDSLPYATTTTVGGVKIDGTTIVIDGNGVISSVGGPGGGSGTVTSVSVVSANGFAGTVATQSTTPAITISTTVTGILKGNGTSVSAAVAGTDYLISSNLYTDYDNTVTGLRNSSNTVFQTSFNFVSGSTRVFVNGLRYSRGASFDYQETAANQITFTTAPDSGDLIVIDYIKV